MCPMPDDSTAKARILVADDSAVARHLLKQSLKDAGYRVKVAKDGTEAIQLLENTTFDLVLLDNLMPGANGPDVLRKMRAMDAHKGVPVIMITAKSDMKDVEEAIAIGADDYVVKPPVMPIVLGKIEQYLARRSADDAD